MYRVLRDEAPIHWALESEVWCLSRYQDVEFALTHPDLFSSRTGRNGPGVPMSELGPIERVVAIARSLWTLRASAASSSGR